MIAVGASNPHCRVAVNQCRWPHVLQSGQRVNFQFETRFFREGLRHVAGVDEVGRGPLAGPVTVAAVILDPKAIPEGLNDSKKLGEARRESLYDAILASAHVSVVSLPAREIDRINILQATFQAMRLAVAGLPLEVDIALIDGRDVPRSLCCRGHAVIGGDALILSIAAASIVAKVTRDRLMKRAHETFPAYGFASHKGYATAEHLSAIDANGITPLHRRSFAPCARDRVPVAGVR